MSPLEQRYQTTSLLYARSERPRHRQESGHGDGNDFSAHRDASRGTPDQAVPAQYATAGPTAATVQSEVDRLVDGRFRVARLQAFVADSSRREMTVPHTPLTPGHVADELGLREQIDAIHSLGQMQPPAGKRGQVLIHSFGRGTRLQAEE